MSQPSQREDGPSTHQPRNQQKSGFSFLNKSARATVAKETINEIIPNILKSDERARRGVKEAIMIRGAAELPKLSPCNVAGAGKETDHPNLIISLSENDTLAAARNLYEANPDSRIAILNMASPLQPGGGVLRGAKAQEETLCMRTTLYPSLKREWYRHPEDAVIYTSDVLVFKSASPELRMLDKSERFYVDVISCAAVRMPDLNEVQDDKWQKKQLVYADPKDEEMMSLKIKYILRTAAKMGVQRLVLGALGCGAYRNPVSIVAKMMKRCLLGRANGKGPEEDWAGAGIEEVVIAILDGTPERKVWNTFAELSWL